MPLHGAGEGKSYYSGEVLWIGAGAFAKALDKDGAEALRSYLIAQAQKAKAQAAAGFAPF